MNNRKNEQTSAPPDFEAGGSGPSLAPATADALSAAEGLGSKSENPVAFGLAESCDTAVRLRSRGAVMSGAGNNFKNSIQDAENLLQHFDSLNDHPPAPELEVLKRAGLIMAMTAWETYVEDRVVEACTERLSGLTDRSIAEFVQCKLAEEISRLNNPASGRTIQLFREYANVDLEQSWNWNNVEVKAAREQLDSYMKLRGDIVHRSRPLVPDTPAAHPVKKEDLRKVIGFLKNLVDATERAFRSAA